MKKILPFVLIPFLFWCRCSEKTYNYYLTEEKGSLAGVVEPAESGARVSAWQAKEIAFTYIDSTGYFIITDLPVGTYTIKVEAEGYTTYESKSYTVYGGGTTTAGTVTLRPFPDLISSVYPPDKAEGVSLQTVIRIYFKESMDKESVTGAFSMDPSTAGSFEWRDDSHYGTRLEFYPSANLLPGVTYTVSLETTAQDTAGNHLSEPFSFCFTTIGVGVESFYPGDGESDVWTGKSISIYFNTTMNRESVEDAFGIDPPTSGSFHWYRSSKRDGGGADYLYFNPHVYLRTSTLYTVTLDTIAQDTNGVRISEVLSFSFATQELRIDDTYPRDGYTGLPTDRRITVCFNAPMNQTAAEEAFTILPPTDGELEWNESMTCFYFQPESGYLAAGITYEVRIESTATEQHGEHLPQSYQFSFSTEEIEIVDDYSYPYDQSSGVSTSTYIRVIFNTAMDQLSVADALEITPEVKGGFRWPSPVYFYFYPDQVLASNTQYTVTIDTSARDIYGTNMPETHSFSFTTEKIKVIWTFPQRGATYIDPDTNIIIRFNTDMDQASVVNAFGMMSSDSVEIEGQFSWSGLRQVTLDPESSLAPEEEYTVTIDTGAKDVRGVNMPEPFVLWFKTRP